MNSVKSGLDKEILLLHRKHPELSLKEAGFFKISDKCEGIQEYVYLKTHYLDKPSNNEKMKEFINTNCYDFNKDSWIINIRNCDPAFDNDVIIKSTINYLEGKFYNQGYNYDLLKNGINVEIDMEGFRMSVIKWSLVKQGNILLSAYPFNINRIIVKNAPNYITKLYFLAKKIFNKEAYSKIELQS